MRKLKLFFACLLMAVLSIGQVWATDFTLSSAEEVTKDGITVTFAKGDGSNAPAWYSAGLRLYVKNTVTITSTSNITAISFTWEKQGSKTFNTSCTASTGSYTHPSSAGVGTWTGSATSVTFTLGNVSGAQLQLNTFSVTTDGGGSSDPTLSVDPTVIDFGTVEQNAVVASQTVEVSFANLTGSVAYSGLSSPFTASGTISSTGDEITIAANTANVGNYSQTLTVQSTADSKSAEVTVKMNVVEPFDGLKLTFDVSSNPGEWPTTNSTTTTNYTYTLNEVDYTFALNNVKCNSGYLMLTSVAKLGLPAISGYKLVKIEATNSSGCSTSTQVSVSSSATTKTDVTGGTAQTWGTTSTKYTYNLSGTEENTMYYLWIANKNCQLVELTLYYEEAEAATVATPVIFGTESFLTSTEVSIACTTDGATVYYTTDGTDPKTSESKLTYSAAFTLTNTATVRAIANLGAAWSAEATSKTFTKITPLTVAEAIAAIPNVDDVVNSQYVAGIVCTAGTSVNASGQMTYYISADGSEGTRLQIYLGKNINNTAFSSVSDLAIGDRVVVFGQLKNYKGTYEMNSGNYLVSKEGPAVATPVFDPNGGGFMGETDVTITCATASSTIYYTLDGTTPTKSSNVYSQPIHINATTTITAIAYVGEEHSIVVAKEFTLTAPMTVADALTALDTEDPINNVAVAGIISTAPTANPSSGKLTYYISDDGSDTDELEVYLGYGLNGASFSAKTDLQVGDEVTVFGNLTIFNSTTKEFASGSRLLAFNRPVVAVTGIDLTESIAEVEVGKTVTLHASVVPANATNKTIVWSVQSGSAYASVADGVVTGIAAGEAVIRAASDEDATIFAECTVTVTEPAPLSPWATVYTSNVELKGNSGTKAYAEKVKITVEEVLTEFDALRACTGSAAGSCTVKVPAGTQTLHFHAAAWNAKTSTITVTMGETELLVQALAADAGIKNSSPYTLEGIPYEYYYSIDLSSYSLTEETTITFSAGSDKRFVLFGVNQVGGSVPVLDHLAITGTMTNTTGWKTGDNIEPEGLTVTAYYTLNDAAHHNTDVTADVTWSHAPLTEGLTEVTLTATYTDGVEKSASTNVTIDAVETGSPTIITTPATQATFTTTERGAALPAAKTIAVTLKNITSATATLDGTNPGVFSLSKTTDIVDGDEISVSVVSTDIEVASYSATVTIKDASGDTQKSINIYLTIKEPEAVETPVGTDTKWIPATSIVDGMKVLITGANDDDTFAMGAQSGNNRSAVKGSFDAENHFVPGEGTMAFTLVKQADDSYALQTSDSKYLYAGASGNNRLLTREAIGEDNNANWTVAVNALYANGDNRGVMQFNNGSTKLFNCYGSASQSSVALYVLYVAPTTYAVNIATGIENGTVAADPTSAEAGGTITLTITPADGYELSTLSVIGDVSGDEVTVTSNQFTMPAEDVTVNATFSLIPTPPTPVYETVRTGLEVNRYYTVCLPKKVTAIKGASFWTLNNKSQDGATAYLEEETNNLPFAAGTPFIIQATAENLEVVYEGDATEVAGTNGALYGTLVYMNAAALAAAGSDIYMLFSNELRPVGENNHLDANRAYVKLSDLDAVAEAPQSAPGRRVVAMPMEKDVTTDINALNAAEAPVKIIIDGNLFILRGEKLYDATGRLVK